MIEKKPKFKDEVIVTFEDKSTRNAVKAQAHRLTDHREEAGMRLHIPDHQQQTFRALMNLSYELKKQNPGLKRSVKFDEDTLNMFMNIQTSAGNDWKRVDSEQALQYNDKRRTTANVMDTAEPDGLLAGSTT